MAAAILKDRSSVATRMSRTLNALEQWLVRLQEPDVAEKRGMGDRHYQ
jgi:hypothetical protein